MRISAGYITLLFLFLTLWCALPCVSQISLDDQHIAVSMRMIGHQILLNAGDTTSRVLPIHQDGDQYKIEMENAYVFHPDQQIKSINEIVKETKIANGYFLELYKSSTHEVVYNYKIADVYALCEKDLLDNSLTNQIASASTSNIIPCGTRPLPADRYIVYVTLMNDKAPLLSLAGGIFPNGLTWVALLVLIPILMTAVLYFIRRKKSSVLIDNDPNIISIGEYQLDTRNMLLSFQNSQEELSSKEADLLFLLHSAANNTLEREAILKAVWGDVGDYVGRTLDVFISKLRKKLKSDPNIKIINIRGIGYRLVLNVG